MWHLVGRRGLVVTDSVVTRRLGHVKGIMMNLETVRFPGEKLLHREELECRGDCVQGLRQCSLLYFFDIFKPLRYTCRRNQRVLKRRLVQPRYSVSHLRITQVQQRRSGCSLCLSRVDFKRSLWRSHSLSEDLVSSCWDLLTVTVIVIRKNSLDIRIHGRGKVDQRPILCRKLYWWGSRDWRTWSGISGFAATPSSSDGRPDPSVRCPGRSLWSPKKSLGSSGSSLWSYSQRGWSPGCWVMPGIRCWWLGRRTGWINWNTRLVHPTL